MSKTNRQVQLVTHANDLYNSHIELQATFNNSHIP
jgi:hypothetical protein